jgi:hypothetical protein
MSKGLTIHSLFGRYTRKHLKGSEGGSGNKPYNKHLQAFTKEINWSLITLENSAS